MRINKNMKVFSIMIGIVILLFVIGSFNFNHDSNDYWRNFDKKYESNLNSANSGNWLPEITKPVGNSPHEVFIGDANNDGFNDIVVASSLTYDYSISILLWNTISGDWDPQITRAAGGAVDSVSIGDADNDGDNDIVAINHNANATSILLWNELSSDWDPFITKQVGACPLGLVIADANNDGDNDIITANEGDSTVSILLWNTISGDWDSQIKKTVGYGSDKLFVGDANNDGYNDIATSNFYDDNVSILLWNAVSGDWDSQITREVGKYPRGVSIGDVNNDGDNDIVAASTNDNKVSILLWNNTQGDWDSQNIKTIGVIPCGVFIGDANNDGYNDIATPSNQLQAVSILLWNNISGDWDPQITKTVGNIPRGIFIGDADTDGDNDIVTANAGDDTISILQWDTFAEIIINSPDDNQLFGNFAPSFNLKIVDDNFDTSWYTIDGGLTNYTFVGTTGIINQGAWNAQPNGTVIIRFYINDTTGKVEFSEVIVRKDNSIPAIRILSPTPQTFGSIAPNFSVLIVGYNLDTFWYTIDGGSTNYTFVGTTGIINQGAWNAQPNGTVVIRFYVNSTAGRVVFSEVTVRKDITVPVITIFSPTLQTFGSIAPNYIVSIVGYNLDTFWYTVDGGLTNYSFVQMSGTINQGAWDMRPNGVVIIKFYANSSTGSIGFNEIAVQKYVEQVEEAIPGYNVVVILGTICIVSVIFNNLRHKHNKN